jgi:phosphoribosylamine--glycine ligase
MKVLVIGQGGREHAIVKALSMSLVVTEVHCAPGSDGISREAVCHPVQPEQQQEILNLVKRYDIGLVVIGPEKPLAEGLADYLRAQNVKVFGPGSSAARFEASKSFCKDFFIRHQVPTAKSVEVRSLEDVEREISSFQAPYVLKADGLAAGKGVLVANTRQELMDFAHELFTKRSLGPSGDKAILEEFLEGYELSLLLMTNGREYSPLPLAQDHKRLLEKDRGPNTGGMGAVAPMPISSELSQTLASDILDPIFRGFAKDNVDFRGLLYVGLMITKNGPKVLEFNVRFGDPEAQVLLPLLDGDWAEVFLAIADGQMPEMNWKKNMCVACVVLAAEGYPDHPVKGSVIEGNPLKQTASSYFLHAGTALNPERKWVTNGGRVMNAVGLGSTTNEALKQAYLLVEHGRWPGMIFRRDIGEKSLTSQS